MDLHGRMKQYEGCYKTIITPRSYIIIRLDGKNFKSYTSKLDKPFDGDFSHAMDQTTIALCEEFNCKFAYTQSDEISLVITEIGGSLDAQPQFGNSLQKLCSLTASVATAKFNEIRNKQFLMNKIENDRELVADAISNNFVGDVVDFPKQAHFDSRVFVLPNEMEVGNHMIWRQQDAVRNSVSMAAHALLGHSETMNLTGSEKIAKMINEKDVNWNDYEDKFRHGVIIRKIEVEVPITHGEALNMAEPEATVMRNRLLTDYETPIFTDNMDYLKDLIPTD